MLAAAAAIATTAAAGALAVSPPGPAELPAPGVTVETPAPQQPTTPVVPEPSPPAAGDASTPASCDDYPDVDAAQAALDTDPALGGALDTDGDGLACEVRWPRRVVPADTIAGPATGAAAPGCPSSGFGGVRAHVAQAGHHLAAALGLAADSFGGVAERPDNPTSDHPRGLALDIPARGDVGDEIAAYVLARFDELGVTYLIWKQRINFGDGWEPMEDRGGVTANHFDHVHVSFRPDADVRLTC